ncbi:MAG: SGNH/GDSL hydrolase family protein [Candidatus Binatia bacterium]
MTGAPRVSWARRLALAAGGLLLGLGVGEILFRLVPFERVKYEVRYGHYSGNEVGRFLEYDPILTFRNRRSTSIPQTGVRINAFGLRGPDVSATKRAGVIRVLCLGDSCTFGSLHPYPEMLQAILDERAPGRFEVLNGGVIGYTSVHGLEWFERELGRLSPDVVTLYYGWNDMWRQKDSAVRALFKSRVAGEPQPHFRSYLWEALSRGLVFARNWLGRSPLQAPPPLQVPPEQYRVVLEHFAALGRERRFATVFLTAPAGFDDDQTPPWLVRKGFVARGDSAPRLRQEYNQVVVEVAERERLPLVDLASDFTSGGGRAFFEKPDEDPIHPNQRGYRRIAEALATELLKMFAPIAAAASP